MNLVEIREIAEQMKAMPTEKQDEILARLVAREKNRAAERRIKAQREERVTLLMRQFRGCSTEIRRINGQG